MAESNGTLIEVARSNGFTSKVDGSDRLATEVAGSNGFMARLLAPLDNGDFMTNVTSSTTEVDVKYYLSLVEKILDQAADDIANSSRAKGDQGQTKSLTLPSIGTSAPLSSTINELYDQIKALQTNGVQQTKESLSVKLSSFSWDARAVLTLLALSVYYVENWRRAQFQASDKLLCLMARLRGETPADMTKAFVTLNDLIKETLEFTKYIVGFVSYSKDSGEISAPIDKSAHFYNVILIVLGCSVLFGRMISESNESIEPDLSTFLDWVKKIHQSFNNEVEDFKQMEEERLYQNIEEVFNSCDDIVELLANLFCTKNDSSTVYQCSKRTMVKVEELKNKSVMLLISDLNLSNDDLATLTSIYNASTFEDHEIIWIPVTEAHDETTMKQFLDMRSRMQWYTCTSMVSKAAAKFIREKWQFRQHTKVVLLNPKGKVENMDAMTMIRLWGWKAFPFSALKDHDLWNKQGINWLELVVNNTICPYIEQCFERKDLLFLYGSAEDSRTVHEIEEYLEKINGYSVSPIPIRISKRREQFLTRLESCISSKMQATADMHDPLTHELLKLYTSDKMQGGFAIVARGSRVVVNARLTDFATVLSQYQMWIRRVTQPEAFEAVFKEHYDQVIVTQRCHHLYFPSMVGNLPKSIKCTVCLRDMKTSVTYECCHGAH